MNGLTLMEALAEVGVSVWLEGGRLKYRGPVGAIDDLRDQVASERVSLVQLLQVGGLPCDVRAWTPSERELFEERAGVMEFDGGMPQAEAELFAEARVRFHAVHRYVPPDSSGRSPVPLSQVDG